MKTLKMLVMTLCLASFSIALAGCPNGPGDVRTTDDAKMHLPPAASGKANPGDEQSGIDTRPEG